MRTTSGILIALLSVLGLASCSDMARLPSQSDVGPNPYLTQPRRGLLPTVKVAEAVGWPQGAAPQAAAGLAVRAFAEGLDHPRWLYVLPNGDVLVAETNSPPREPKGVRAWFTSRFMKKAGAATPSANRITLLRDADGNGVAEVRKPFLQNLHSPFGMALIGSDFYVANTDAVLRFKYREGATEIAAEGVKVTDLPAGEPNYHWTKNLLASRDGRKLYVTSGSNSNVAEHGIEQEENRAAILEIDLASGQSRPYASGLRNPNGMAWQPQSGALWTVVNERDELGSDLVPDYLTEVKDGGFYGWPYSYYGQHVDGRASPQRPDLVDKALTPSYALGAHVAALGLTFYTGELLPEIYRGGAFVGLHGSWNRKPLSGYKVVYVPFKSGQPAGMPQNVLTGFVSADDELAYGRPVGVTVDKTGALLVADDVGNKVWRVTPTQ
jgi:glucose/arabinose dehydrogenase